MDSIVCLCMYVRLLTLPYVHIQVQTGMLEIENTTVEGVTITVATAQPPPVPPVIPPEFNDTVSNPVEPVEEYQPVQSGGSNGTAVKIMVPMELVVVHQPADTVSGVM